MSLPAYESGAWAALFLGLLFGIALEGAGFASPRKLTAQFLLRDFAVLKVMFTAVVTAAVGLWLCESLGVIAAKSYFIHTPYYWAMLIGGLLIGAGFAIGGYCPGTSAVGLSAGRLDAAAFIAGMVVGVWVFAGGYSWIAPLYTAAQGPRAQTVYELLGVPAWLIVLVMVGLVAIVYRVAATVEPRFGGQLTAKDIAEGTAEASGHEPGGAARAHHV
jgi:hypothetical protein